MVNLIIVLGILDYFNLVPFLDTTLPITKEIWLVILICVFICDSDN